MSKRYQRGSVYKYRNYWMGQFRQDGKRKSVVLGNRSQMTKTQARQKLAEILHPLNLPEPGKDWKLRDFYEQVWLPFQLRKWKESSAYTCKDRINHHLLSELGDKKLGDFDRDGLQDFLDAKARQVGRSIVRHLRWDLNSMLRMAKEDGYIRTNQAALLFVPHGKEQEKRRLHLNDLSTLLGCLDLREQVICSLAILSGLRPGEIFALRWKHVEENSIRIQQRIYLGKIDCPKNGQERIVAVPQGVMRLIEEYRRTFDGQGEEWVFPSERLTNPVRKDSFLARYVKPKLKKAGLNWVNFQVMRRTHSSLLREMQVDPKYIAEQLGHDVDVTLNVYTQSMLEQRKTMVNELESQMLRAAKEGLSVQ